MADRIFFAIIFSFLVGNISFYMVSRYVNNTPAHGVFMLSDSFLLPQSNLSIYEQCRTSLQESDGFFCEQNQDWSRRKSLHQSQNRKNHASNRRSSFFLDNWESTFHCTFEQRLGSSHGGKWVCDIHKLQANTTHIPLIYSFGSNGDFSFEQVVKTMLPNSEIHTFDKDPFTCPDNVCIFHQILLGDGKKKGTKSFQQIIKELNHQRRTMHILKVDIEGSEFSLFEELFHSNASRSNLLKSSFLQPVPYIHQILVEIHLPWNSGDEESVHAHNLFELFRQNNYVIFHKEANLFDCRSVFEYAFIRLNPTFFRE